MTKDEARGQDALKTLHLYVAPQALHDALDSFQLESSIVTAEAFLKRFGWKVERPMPVIPNDPPPNIHDSRNRG
jgi:hypothetical protein